MNKQQKEEVNQLLNYAVKEGYIDADEVESWNWKQKLDYYRKSELADFYEEEA